MKLHKNLLFGIIASVLCLCDASALLIKEEEATKKCPAGLFCTTNGQYTYKRIKDGKDYTATQDIEMYMLHPAELATKDWGTMLSEGFCSYCTNEDRGDICRYCANDYDELWISHWFGFYAIKNGEIMYRNFGNNYFSGVFACPGTYPSSDEGAKSVYECYTIGPNKQKEYFKPSTNLQNASSGNCNIDIKTFNTLVQDLESALNKAQKLQEDSSKKNTVNKRDRSAEIEEFKTKIKTSIAAQVETIKNEIHEEKNSTTTTSNTSQSPKSSESSNDTPSSKKLDTLKKQISANMITPTKKASDKIMQNKNINSKSAVRF